MKHIGLVTFRRPDGTLRESDDYLALLSRQDSVARAGLTIDHVAWNDIDVDWNRFDAIVIRSTWNYHLPQFTDRFLDWSLSLDAHTLWNPGPMIRWNSDKIYLRDATARFPELETIPTLFFEPANAFDVAGEMERQGWDEAILKPRVGASGNGFRHLTLANAQNGRVELGEPYQRFGGLLQLPIEEVRREGEWSLVYLRRRTGDLSFSHSALKHPAGTSFSVHGGTKEMSPAPPAARVAAERWLEAAAVITDSDVLYARVDGVMVAGRFLLMELELIEPGLSLANAGPEATDRYVEALAFAAGNEST